MSFLDYCIRRNVAFLERIQNYENLIINTKQVKKKILNIDESGSYSSKKSFSRFLKKFLLILLKIFIGIIIFLILITTSLFFLSKSEGFRHWASELVLGFVNNELEGKLDFSDIKIVPIKGLVISNVCLTAAGDTIIYTKELAVNFRLKPFLVSSAIVDRITIEQPRIKILRRLSDSTWNIEHIAKPSEDTTTSEPTWKIDVKKLKIKNASIYFIDSTATISAEKGKFNTGNLHLANFNISLGANINLKKTIYKAKINSLSFNEKNSGFQLKDLSLEALADTKHIEMPDFTIVTAKTRLTAGFCIDSINIFVGNIENNIKKAPFKIELNTIPLNIEEISKLVPLPIKIKGDYKISVEAEGKINDFDLTAFELRFNDSEILLSGHVKNLPDFDKLHYKVKFERTNIYYANLKRNFPDIDFNSIPDFNILNLNNTNADGSMDSARIYFDLKCKLGNVRGTLAAGLGERLNYCGALTTESIDLSLILKNESMKSSLNSNIEFNGSGKSVEDLILKLKVNSANSFVSDYEYKFLKLAVNINKNIINLDTLSLVVKNKLVPGLYIVGYSEESKVLAHGKLDISNITKPIYELHSEFEELNLVALMNNRAAPQFISGNLSVIGEGFAPDSISGDVKIKIEDCLFGDRGLMPFHFDVQLRRNGSELRDLKINSEYLNAHVAGRYTFEKLANLMALQGNTIAEFIESKINIIQTAKENEEDIEHIQQTNKNCSFPAIALELNAEIKDLSLVEIFLKGSKMFTKANLALAINSDENNCHIYIDSLNISNFSFETESVKINSGPAYISSSLSTELTDSLVKISDISLSVTNTNDFYINDLLISEPLADINYRNEQSNFKLSASVSNLIYASLDGNIVFRDNDMNITVNNTNITYNKELTWQTMNPLLVFINNQGINLQQLEFQRKKAESMSLSGKFDFEKAENIQFNLNKFNLEDVKYFLPQQYQEQIKGVQGIIDSVKLTVNGKYDNPEINLIVSTGDLKFNGTSLGSLTTDIKHLNANVSGSMDLIKRNKTEELNVVSISLFSLPIDFSLSDTVKERFHDRLPVKVYVKAEKMPLELIAPFITDIKALSGYANADIFVTGRAPNNIDFNGNITFDQTKFFLSATNMAYTAHGGIGLETNKITLQKIELNNLPEDLPDGKAFISGDILLKDLNLESLDIKIETPGLKVLSNATLNSMPTLYGDFVISTGQRPLNFFGPLDAPNFHGDINVLQANLQMPSASSSKIKKSSLRYEIKGNKYYISSLSDSAIQQGEVINENITENDNGQQKKNGESGAIDFDLNIKIIKPMHVTMELGFLGQLVADISTSDPTQPLRYVMKRGSIEPNLYGNVIVKEGSTLNFGKLFKTHGDILFPTGSMDNPGLNLAAEYSGQSFIDDVPRNFTVNLLITGTKNRPNIHFGYSINGEEATGDSTQISQDALFLLVFGKTKSELAKTKSEISAQGLANETVTSGASALGSKLMTDFVQGTGFIQSADIDFVQGSGGSLFDLEQARLKLSGQIFGNVSWKLGGTVADFTNNNEFSIDIPLPFVLHPEYLNNIILQLTRSTNFTSTTTRNQKEWEFKIKFGGSW